MVLDGRLRNVIQGPTSCYRGSSNSAGHLSKEALSHVPQADRASWSREGIEPLSRQRAACSSFLESSLGSGGVVLGEQPSSPLKEASLIVQGSPGLRRRAWSRAPILQNSKRRFLLRGPKMQGGLTNTAQVSHRRWLAAPVASCGR